MIISLRCLCGRTPSPLPAFRAQQFSKQPTRSILTTASASDERHTKDRNQDKDLTSTDRTRENAIKEREPSYRGWWTEVMNHRQIRQTFPDPNPLLSEDHVFQGRPASSPAPAIPTISETKKGYGNMLPGAGARRIEDTVPKVVSTGSSTFATGPVSSLSSSAARATQYHGFSIPVKPTPPGAEDCCMSGCAHCIYDIYEEDRQDYKRKLAEVLEKIKQAGLPPPPNIKTGAAGGDGKDADDDMDPGMKAFLELERKLKG